MKIKPCSLEKFQQLPQKERFKYKVSGLVHEALGKENGIWTKPKNEYQAFGNMWASVSNIIKDIVQK